MDGTHTKVNGDVIEVLVFYQRELGRVQLLGFRVVSLSVRTKMEFRKEQLTRAPASYLQFQNDITIMDELKYKHREGLLRYACICLGLW